MVEVAAAALHANGFGYGNLYVIDITAVPDRLEDSVGETESHNVLNGFLAQIMVDPVDLLFVRHFEDLLIQNLRRFQIVTERFFNNDSAPVSVALIQ